MDTYERATSAAVHWKEAERLLKAYNESFDLLEKSLRLSENRGELGGEPGLMVEMQKMILMAAQAHATLAAAGFQQ